MSTFSGSNRPPNDRCGCGHVNCPICNPPKTLIRWGEIDGNIINQKDLVDWLSTKQDDRNAIREAVIFNQNNKQDMFPDYNPLGRAENRYGNEPSRQGYNKDDIMTAGITLPVTTAILQRGAKNYGAARPITEVISSDQAEGARRLNDGYWKSVEARLDPIPTATAVRTNVNRIDTNIGYYPPADPTLGHSIQEQIDVNRRRMVDAEARLDANDTHNAGQDDAIATLDRQIGQSTHNQNDPAVGGIPLQVQLNTHETWTGINADDYHDLGNLQDQIKNNDKRAQDAEEALDTKYQELTDALDARLTILDDTTQYQGGTDLDGNPVMIDQGRVLRLEQLTGITDTDFVQEGSLQYQIQDNYQYFESIKNGTQVMRLDQQVFDRVPNNITMVPTSFLPSYLAKVYGVTDRLIVNDAVGTIAVYRGLNPNDSTQMQFQTISFSPFGDGHHALLGVIETKAELDGLATMHDIIAAFPELTFTPTIDDYIWVTNDESKFGAVVKYFITDIQPPSGPGIDPTTQQITYGAYEVISTPTGQAPTTSAMVGRLLTGGTQPGQFGPSRGILNAIEQNADDIPTSNAVWNYVDPLVQHLSNWISSLTQQMLDADEKLTNDLADLKEDHQNQIDGKQDGIDLTLMSGKLLTGGTDPNSWGTAHAISDVIDNTVNGDDIPNVDAVRNMIAHNGLQQSTDTGMIDKLLTGGNPASTFGDPRDIIDTSTGMVAGENGIPTVDAVVNYITGGGSTGGGLFQDKTKGASQAASYDYRLTITNSVTHVAHTAVITGVEYGSLQYSVPPYASSLNGLFTYLYYNFGQGAPLPITLNTSEGVAIINSATNNLGASSLTLSIGPSTSDLMTMYGSIAADGTNDNSGSNPAYPEIITINKLGGTAAVVGDAGMLLTGGLVAGTWGTPHAIATTLDNTDPLYDPSSIPTASLLSTLPAGGGLITTIDGSGKVTLEVDNIIVNNSMTVVNVDDTIGTSVPNVDWVIANRLRTYDYIIGMKGVHTGCDLYVDEANGVYINDVINGITSTYKSSHLSICIRSGGMSALGYNLNQQPISCYRSAGTTLQDRVLYTRIMTDGPFVMLYRPTSSPGSVFVLEAGILTLDSIGIDNTGSPAAWSPTVYIGVFKATNETALGSIYSGIVNVTLHLINCRLNVRDIPILSVSNVVGGTSLYTQVIANLTGCLIDQSSVSPTDPTNPNRVFAVVSAPTTYSGTQLYMRISNTQGYTPAAQQYYKFLTTSGASLINAVVMGNTMGKIGDSTRLFNDMVGSPVTAAAYPLPTGVTGNVVMGFNV